MISLSLTFARSGEECLNKIALIFLFLFYKTQMFDITLWSYVYFVFLFHFFSNLKKQ